MANLLNVIYINIRSVRNKSDDLEELIRSFNYTVHVLVITETCLLNVEARYFNLNGYVAVHNCHTTGSGGAAIYITKEINFQTNVSPIMSDCNTEQVKILGEKLRTTME